MIDPSTVKLIKDTADIVEVVSDYVHLIRRGANYVGLCPFHNERTPSFSVSRAKNFCYCFSCHKGGSPVNFIMEKEGISYHDALLQLAKKYGIKVEEKQITDEEKERQSRREGMFVANEWAMKLFEENLFDTEDGRDIALSYLYGRGVTEEAIKQFHLGYALDKSSSFLDSALKKGFNVDLLQSLGLVGQSQQGNYYDRFRGRVIFPIQNSSGKVIAFGGRDLKGGPAKYINSPESELYKKSNELYGMFQARQSIVREDRCFLVEGYLDVIGMWQSGMKNVVASSGTALTDGQISLIHRFTKNVTLIYDGDAAGIKASLRGIDMLLSHQLDVKVLLLPDGHDPDSFARANSAERFRQYVKENETDIIRFKTRVLMNEANDDPQKRVEAVRSVVRSLAHIPDKVKRDIYIQECSALLGISEESVGAATAKARIEVIEQLRKQRELQKLNHDLDSGRISSHSSRVIPQSDTNAGITSNNTSNPTSPSHKPTQELTKTTPMTDNPLQPLEWKMLEYCIRFGFLDFCLVDENEGENKEEIKNVFTVVEWLYEELKLDGISFSDKRYGQIFQILLNMVPEFKKQLDDFKLKLNSEIVKKREEGFEDIALRGISINEIQKEEKFLEDKLQKYYDDELFEFSRSYPGKELASHEDNTVRLLTTKALQEKHRLSNIYRKDETILKEEDKLSFLIISAYEVWRHGILDKKIKDLFEDMRKAGINGLQEEERQLQLRLAELMRHRSEIAKNIGERIINPSTGGFRKFLN